MRRYFMILGLILAVFAASASSTLTAQEEMAGMEEETLEESEYSYGEVSSISSDQIVVKEFDYESNSEIETAYLIDNDTILDGVNSLGDVSVGDMADIEYELVGGDRIAKMIFVESAYEGEHLDMDEELEAVENELSQRDLEMEKLEKEEKEGVGEIFPEKSQ